MKNGWRIKEEETLKRLSCIHRRMDELKTKESREQEQKGSNLHSRVVQE